VAAYDGAALALSTRACHVAGMAPKDNEREERLAAALRENLRKRKAQARAGNNPSFPRKRESMNEGEPE
jgi:hypothetical protein